jgi:HD-GYP domain-containing protein (c-di-GMP phosphodiesterase class II)
MAERADDQLVKLGKRLVRAFFVLHKTASNYAKGHPAMAQPLEELVTVVKEYDRRRDEASLSFEGEHLFAGELRLKPDASGFDAFFTTMRVLRRHGIGAVVFSPGTDAAELEAWFSLLREGEATPADDPFAALAGRMEAQGISGVTVERPAEPGQAAAEAGDGRERSKAIYAKTLEVISDVMEHVKLGKALRLKSAKRAVQTMIDLLLTAETNLLGLTTIRCYDEYTYNHSVNVGILSMAIGQRVGMSKNSLVDVGMAALFHDIGKSCIPITVLNKPAPFDDQEWSVIRRHPIFGVKELLKLKGVDALTARIMLGAFEHHLNVDRSGYPAVPYPREVSLVGRIISIADCYDALTSSRVYRRTAETPDQTLRYILQKSGTLYDPVLAKLFVNAVGVYPIGSLVLLSTQELAVVLRGNADPEKWQTPRVKIIGTAEGEFVDGGEVDLDDQRAGRQIRMTVDAHKYGIDVARYFL